MGHILNAVFAKLPRKLTNFNKGNHRESPVQKSPMIGTVGIPFLLSTSLFLPVFFLLRLRTRRGKKADNFFDNWLACVACSQTGRNRKERVHGFHGTISTDLAHLASIQST